MKLYILLLAGIVQACSYPLANSGENESKETSSFRSGAAVNPTAPTSNVINLKCDCNELLSVALSEVFGVAANSVETEQLRCSFSDPSNSNSKLLTIDVARVVSRDLFESMVARKKEQIPLITKEIYTDEPVGDAEAKLLGTDGDRNIYVSAQFVSRQGYVIVMSEFADDSEDLPVNGAALRLIDIRKNIAHSCSE